jgi:hypothetical protein
VERKLERGKGCAELFVGVFSPLPFLAHVTSLHFLNR